MQSAEAKVMARINLYIPDELKRRLESRTDINWSAEFQRVVEEKTKRDWLIVSSKSEARQAG